MTENTRKGCLWALLIILLCPWIVVLIPILFGLFMGLFGVGMGLFGAGIGLFAILPAVLSVFLSSGWISVLLISVLVAVLLPIVFLICAAIKLVRGNGLPRWQTWLLVILLWLLSIGGIVATGVQAVRQAGGIEALHEQLANQTQVWEYSWSNAGESPETVTNDTINENL